jgi:hypothetical protein
LHTISAMEHPNPMAPAKANMEAVDSMLLGLSRQAAMDSQRTMPGITARQHRAQAAEGYQSGDDLTRITTPRSITMAAIEAISAKPAAARTTPLAIEGFIVPVLCPTLRLSRAGTGIGTNRKRQPRRLQALASRMARAAHIPNSSLATLYRLMSMKNIPNAANSKVTHQPGETSCL